MKPEVGYYYFNEKVGRFYYVDSAGNEWVVCNSIETDKSNGYGSNRKVVITYPVRHHDRSDSWGYNIDSNDCSHNLVY